MSQDKLQRQAELPASIQLFRYNPERLQFNWESWDPAKVRSAKDLPPYLILGPLDESTFKITSEGWSAIWQGTEKDTHFKIKYLAAKTRYEINQNWCGVDGGFSIYTSQIPLGKLITTLYIGGFPSSWDREAKNALEQKYQITYIEQPKEYPTMCGIPDGTFKTVAFPVSIRNLRPVREWLQKITIHSDINYPISAEAKLIFQAINYLEGKAPDWTTNENVVFIKSLDETGIVPDGFPVRETANNGSLAWTLRRHIYVLFIGLPFAGLTDLFEKMVTTDGPIRFREADPLRVQLQPIVIPPMTEFLTQNISFFDKEQTTRCFLQFFNPGDAPPVPSINDFIHGEAVADDLLLKAESISDEVTESIHQIVDKHIKK